MPVIRRAFKMQLHPGFAEEYKRRHYALWPELKALLKESGIHEYSIFLDETTHALFGVMQVEDPAQLDNLPEIPIMKKSWAHMRDIMDAHPDNAPVSVPLTEVFHLP